MRFDKPIVAVVNGLCRAGVEILLATDIWIAAGTASFGFPEPIIGFVPAGGDAGPAGAGRSAMRRPWSSCSWRGIDARPPPAHRRAQPGRPARRAAGRGPARAERLGVMSSEGAETIKQSGLEFADLPPTRAFAREARLGQRTFTSDDAREGLRAFADRRTKN